MMCQMKKEDLEKIMTDIDTCIKLVKDISSNYDSKIHYPILGQSVISSINKTINDIVWSTANLNGYYLMCDEIDPIKLTDYLFELRQYDVDKRIASYYVAFYLKRKINEFYKNLKEDRFPMGLAMLNDKKGLKKYYNKCDERVANGLKLLRSKK